MAGVNIKGGRLRIEPRLPPDWKWLALRRLPYRGRTISLVVVREDETPHIRATEPLDLPHVVTACGDDVSDKVEVWSDQASVVAFVRDDELHLFIGNSSAQTLIVPFERDDLVDGQHGYKLRAYNSEYGGWVEGGEHVGEDLRGLAVPIELHGFFIIHLQWK